MGQTIPMGFRSHTEQKSSASKTVNIFISPFSCYLHPKCKKALQRRRFDLKIGISWFRDCCCSLQLCSQPCVIQSHSCPIMEPGKASSSLCLVSLLLTELLWLWLLLLFGPVCVSMLLKLRDFSAFLRYCKNATGPVIYFSKANTHTCATKKTKQKWKKKFNFPLCFVHWDEDNWNRNNEKSSRELASYILSPTRLPPGWGPPTTGWASNLVFGGGWKSHLKTNKLLACHSSYIVVSLSL